MYFVAFQAQKECDVHFWFLLNGWFDKNVVGLEMTKLPYCLLVDYVNIEDSSTKKSNVKLGKFPLEKKS